jgi:hypothetical protein
MMFIHEQLYDRVLAGVIAGADGRALIVTLKTVDGFEVSFGAFHDLCRSLASDLKRESAVVPAVAPARTNWPIVSKKPIRS